MGNFAKRVAAASLKFSLISIMFLGSCAGPGIAYYQSPKWAIKDVDLEKAVLFFVAFAATGSDGSTEVHVERLGFDPSEHGFDNFTYRLPEDELSFRWRRDEVGATISVTPGSHGDQLVQIFMVGETPWSSLSEYRVVEKAIQPLRYVKAVPWLLLGVLICPFLVVDLLKGPICRAIDRTMRVSEIT